MHYSFTISYKLHHLVTLSMTANFGNVCLIDLYFSVEPRIDILSPMHYALTISCKFYHLVTLLIGCSSLLVP